MKGSPRLVAIGGGGFTHGLDRELDEFVLDQSAGSQTRLGFLGAASRNDPERIRRFHDRFDGVAARALHLDAAASAREVAAWTTELDAVYVGGGDTGHLLDTWRASGVDLVLLDAARRGLLLAGVSAGAAVWFEYALSDAGGRGLRPLGGLGLFAGSFCPHYSTERARRPEFERRVARGEMPEGLAIDDGAAVLVDASGPRMIRSARPGAWAYRLRCEGDRPVTERLVAS